MTRTFFIKTFGCQQNVADSQRISSYYLARGYKASKSLKSATEVVINTCMIRQSAEDRVTGLVKNIVSASRLRRKSKPKIVITGCMVGMATRDETGKYLRDLKNRMPEVDEFLPLDEIGFDYPALRNEVEKAWVPISNGCNNFCTFCVVPFTRGREVSRPFKDIIDEIKDLVSKGCRVVTLLGQNVNSYGADIIKSKIKNQKSKFYKLPNGKRVKPVMVKHLGRFRIPTLFPYLLEEVCKIDGIETVKFISSNRWYSREEYLDLLKRIRAKIPAAQISTDIIVGFPGETKKQFQNTVRLAKAADFAYAYVAKYSLRPNTVATKAFPDDITHAEKERRFHFLDQLINHKGSPRTAVH